MDSLVAKKEVLKSQCNVTVTDAYNTNYIVYSMQMYILYSLPCPSPGDSSFCMHWNAIATALWQLQTATNPRCHRHTWLLARCRNDLTCTWMGSGLESKGISQIQEGLIRDLRFCYSNTCYFDDLRSFSTCLKVGEITYHPYLNPPRGLGVKSPINQPISLWDIAVIWWAGWNSKWSIRLMWVIYLHGDKSVIRPNSSCNQPLWIAISKEYTKPSVLPNLPCTAKGPQASAQSLAVVPPANRLVAPDQTSSPTRRRPQMIWLHFFSVIKSSTWILRHPFWKTFRHPLFCQIDPLKTCGKVHDFFGSPLVCRRGCMVGWQLRVLKKLRCFFENHLAAYARLGEWVLNNIIFGMYSVLLSFSTDITTLQDVYLLTGSDPSWCCSEVVWWHTSTGHFLYDFWI